MAAQTMGVEAEVIFQMFQKLCQYILFTDWKKGVQEREESRMTARTLDSTTGRKEVSLIQMRKTKGREGQQRTFKNPTGFLKRC